MNMDSWNRMKATMHVLSGLFNCSCDSFASVSLLHSRLRVSDPIVDCGLATSNQEPEVAPDITQRGKGKETWKSRRSEGKRLLFGSGEKRGLRKFSVFMTQIPAHRGLKTRIINDHETQVANRNTYTEQPLVNNNLLSYFQPRLKIHPKSLRISLHTLLYISNIVIQSHISHFDSRPCGIRYLMMRE